MADQDEQEKSEQPSAKKLKEGRDKGQVAKSVEINSLVIFTTGLIILFMTQRFVSSRISESAYSIFNSLDVLTINKDKLQDLVKDGIIYFIVTLLPVFAAVTVAALASSIAQVGFKFSVKAISPKFNKISPANIKKVLFSSRSLMELGKSLLKLIVIGWFTYSVLENLVLGTSNLVEMSIPAIVQFMVDGAYQLIWKISLVFLIIASIDYSYQRFKYKKSMMMSKHEVKEENKESEGDPQIKARVRRIQYQMAKSRMMKDVPTADVVITNPTHFAVAIRYDGSKDRAPRVIAKGMDSLAQKIKEVAKKNNVPIHEDVMLARALYKLCDVGEQIPEALFKAVAQILAYIFKLKREKKKYIV